ncbi:MAG: glucosamine-6-phosphate deaminase [Verrucomicrobiae bacterium]|nr:glucosamine-6-phosphate deaminase [Verrucomicrobiae bacterium]
MEVIIKPNASEASVLGAKIIAQQIRRKPATTLGLATGSTPLKLYRELVRMHKTEKLSFARVRTFNLDEYVGLDPRHPASYNAFMRENLFDLVNIRKTNIHIPSGLARDIPKYCAEYEKKIRKCGGIDLQLLGIGTDGHIGFNEPSSSFASRTRIKSLTEKTIKDNADFFDDPREVPRHVITMGVGTIMDSRTCVLLAFGAKKAEIIARMVEGPVTAMVPATALQFHPSAVVIVDEAAAAALTRRDYYRWVYENKPQWQTYE